MWDSIHSSYHIVIACDWIKCLKYLPFQGDWDYASKHGVSLHQWWLKQFSALDEGLAWDHGGTCKYP
jgi:hypothetical protein